MTYEISEQQNNRMQIKYKFYGMILQQFTDFG